MIDKIKNNEEKGSLLRECGVGIVFRNAKDGVPYGVVFGFLRNAKDGVPYGSVNNHFAGLSSIYFHLTI